MSWISRAANAFSEPSAEIPKDSRNLRANSRQRTTKRGWFRGWSACVQCAQHGRILCARTQHGAFSTKGGVFGAKKRSAPANNFLTTSTLALDSQRGMDASLWRHFSG